MGERMKTAVKVGGMIGWDDVAEECLVFQLIPPESKERTTDGALFMFPTKLCNSIFLHIV